MSPPDAVFQEETMTTSDQSLLQRFAIDHDEAAFAALAERHQQLVLGVCRRVLGNVHDAEDAAQAVFLILAKRAGTVSGATLAPWLHRVATNCARDAWQARRRREHHQREAAAMPPPTPALQLGDELDGALCALPESERAVIVQFHLEGRSLEAIAASTGRPVATIGYWLQRGRKRLASILGKR